jgi:ABC-type amino acid transport system permease subunit
VEQEIYMVVERYVQVSSTSLLFQVFFWYTFVNSLRISCNIFDCIHLDSTSHFFPDLNLPPYPKTFLSLFINLCICLFLNKHQATDFQVKRNLLRMVWEFVYVFICGCSEEYLECSWKWWGFHSCSVAMYIYMCVCVCVCVYVCVCACVCV